MPRRPTNPHPELVLREHQDQRATYQPLASIWYGPDSVLLERMLDFCPRKRPELILDATANRGRFWNGSARKIIRLDIDPRYRPDVVADNRRMPFTDRSFDVVVYDPPHVPNQGKDRRKDFNTRFGLVLKSPVAKGYNFTYLYPPFIREAYCVLCPEGILLLDLYDTDMRYL